MEGFPGLEKEVGGGDEGSDLGSVSFEDEEIT